MSNIIDLWKADSLEQQLVSENQGGCPRFPCTVDFRFESERAQTIKAIADKQTDYGLHDVTYSLNKYGFRGAWDLPLNNSIAFFGCSFTFGAGIKESDTFVSLIGRGTGKPVANFGVPGSSCQRTTRYFSLISKATPIDTAIIMMPHVGRLENITQHNGKIITTNVVPNWPETDPIAEETRAKIYAALSDEYLINDAIRAVDHCAAIAKANSTRIFFTSWDPIMYGIISKYKVETLPMFEALEFRGAIREHMARDGIHPGPASHRNFANKVIKILNEP